MAYDASSEIKKELALLDKNDRGDKVAVQLITYKDKTKGVAIDIRNMYTDAGGEIKPTAKGIRLSSDMMAEVIISCFNHLSEEDREKVMGELF